MTNLQKGVIIGLIVMFVLDELALYWWRDMNPGHIYQITGPKPTGLLSWGGKPRTVESNKLGNVHQWGDIQYAFR
jgi:hypothetical protein